jgi:hypothetical protein
MLSISQEQLIEGSEPQSGSNNMYLGMIGDPGGVVKVDLNTFSVVDRLDFNNGENAHALVLDDEYLYCGTSSSPAKIIKIRLSDFTRVQDATLPKGFSIAYWMRIDENYLYVSCAASGKLARLNKDTLTMVDYANATYLNARGYVKTDGYIYLISFKSGSYPNRFGVLQKLNINDLSEEDVIPFH